MPMSVKVSKVLFGHGETETHHVVVSRNGFQSTEVYIGTLSQCITLAAAFISLGYTAIETNETP